MHLVSLDENRITRFQHPHFFADPLFQGPLHTHDYFFLVRVLVEVMSLSWKEFDIDNGQVLVVRRRRIAEPTQRAPIQLLTWGFGSNNKFFHLYLLFRVVSGKFIMAYPG